MQADEPFEKPRSQDGLYEDPLQFLWAISYADMLMVLMSFFVIYFSMDQAARKTVFDEIVVSLERDVKAEKLEGGSGSSESGTPGSNQERTPTSKAVAQNQAYNPLFEEKKETDLSGPITFQAVEKVESFISPKSQAKVVKNGYDQLVIHFPDNIYMNRGYLLPEESKQELSKLLDALKPFEQQIHLTFIGHADSRPIRIHPGDLIDSNLILSNLRATKAAEHAIRVAGFDPNAISTGGFGEFGRGTRSFSIRITERGPP